MVDATFSWMNNRRADLCVTWIKHAECSFLFIYHFTLTAYEKGLTHVLIIIPIFRKTLSVKFRKSDPSSD